MIDELYQKDLLRLAASAASAKRLESPDASVTMDNPLCGDRVTIDLSLANGRISAVGYDVKGCVLCQGSASVLAAHAVGETAQSLRALQDAVRSMLEGNGGLDGQWNELGSFRPVAAHKSRHNCVLLPFQTVVQAAKKAAES